MTQADLLPVDARQRASTALKSGQQRKAEGQALVWENEDKEWRERFTFLAKCYLASLPDDALFAIEDLRAYADTCGLPAPHSSNVWGTAPRRLMKAGLPIRGHRVSLYRKTSGGAA